MVLLYRTLAQPVRVTGTVQVNWIVGFWKNSRSLVLNWALPQSIPIPISISKLWWSKNYLNNDTVSNFSSRFSCDTRWGFQVIEPFTPQEDIKMGSAVIDWIIWAAATWFASWNISNLLKYKYSMNNQIWPSLDYLSPCNIQRRLWLSCTGREFFTRVLPPDLPVLSIVSRRLPLLGRKTSSPTILKWPCDFLCWWSQLLSTTQTVLLRAATFHLFPRPNRAACDSEQNQFT